jgi:DNA gyrase subunit B
MAYDRIKRLEGIEHIQRRAGVYIGDNSTPTHLVQEVLDNSIDEVSQAGGTGKVTAQIKDGYFRVEDNGRGFPFGSDKENGHGEDDTPYMVSSFINLFSGGKFDTDSYQFSGGMNGLGLTCVNALCSYVEVSSWRGDKAQVAIFKESKLSTYQTPKNPLAGSGTVVEAWPDQKYFLGLNFDVAKIKRRLRLNLFSMPKVTVIVNGDEIHPYTMAEVFGGEFHTPVIEASATDSNNGNKFKIYVAYDLTAISGKTTGSINRLQVDEGAHIRSCESAVCMAFSRLFSSRNILPQDSLIGIRMYVDSQIHEPVFTSQSKEKLGGRQEQFKAIYESLADQIEEQLKSKTFNKYREALLDKFAEYRLSQQRMTSSKYLDSVIEMGGTGDQVSRHTRRDSKLIDCLSSSREDTELFLVEGDSAGGTVVDARDDDIHAVLPLKGKILNIIDMDFEVVLENIEVRSLFNSLGSGVLHKEDISQLRYGKIIIGSDADVDGSHIENIIIGGMAYMTPKLLMSGRVYIAKTPLYIQRCGSEIIPVYEQESLTPKLETRRIKGLGELNPEDAYEVFFGKHRKLIQIVGDSIAEVKDMVRSSSAKKKILQPLKLSLSQDEVSIFDEDLDEETPDEEII